MVETLESVFKRGVQYVPYSRIYIFFVVSRLHILIHLNTLNPFMEPVFNTSTAVVSLIQREWNTSAKNGIKQEPYFHTQPRVIVDALSTNPENQPGQSHVQNVGSNTVLLLLLLIIKS